MGTLENHMNLYKTFKKDAENKRNSKQSRVELYFLSIFHFIEACAAKYNTHINKHQRIRNLLEENTQIFKEQTEMVWRTFQTIETRLRPKFSYGSSWLNDDFNELKNLYEKIEKICMEVI